jgi:hypothetical protein
MINKEIAKLVGLLQTHTATIRLAYSEPVTALRWVESQGYVITETAEKANG